MPQNPLNLTTLTSPSWPLACATIDIQIMAELKKAKIKHTGKFLASDTGLNSSFPFEVYW